MAVVSVITAEHNVITARNETLPPPDIQVQYLTRVGWAKRATGQTLDVRTERRRCGDSADKTGQT